MTMANVIATIVAKHFAQFSLAAFQGAILIQLFHLWLFPPPPFSPCTPFVLLGFCFRTKSLGSLCFLLARLWLANFPVFRWIYWGSRAYFFRLRGRGGWQCRMRCRFNTFAVRFYSPTAIKQFLSALKCVYM